MSDTMVCVPATVPALASPRSVLVLTPHLAFVNGMLACALDQPKRPLPESVEDQLRGAMANLDVLLAPHQLSRLQVVAVTVHAKDLARFERRIETAYAELFDIDHAPTRSLVGVTALPRDALVSMDFVIVRA